MSPVCLITFQFQTQITGDLDWEITKEIWNLCSCFFKLRPFIKYPNCCAWNDKPGEPDKGPGDPVRSAHAALVGPTGIKCVRTAAGLYTAHTYIVSCKY